MKGGERQVIGHGVLYGRSDILGTCCSPDYLGSHCIDNRNVVSLTMPFTGKDQAVRRFRIERKTRGSGMVPDPVSDGGCDER